MNLELLQKAVELRGATFVKRALNELLVKLTTETKQTQSVSADAEAIHELLCANTEVVYYGTQLRYDIEKRIARMYLPTLRLTHADKLVKLDQLDLPSPYCALTWTTVELSPRLPDLSVAVLRGPKVSDTARATQEQIDQLRQILDEYQFGLQAAVNFHLRTYGKPCMFTYVHTEDGVEFVL